jgi:mRNA interferase MazF
VTGKKPRQGWIYFINPYRLSLRCKLGHYHIYHLDEPGEIYCKTNFCMQIINSSRVFRGEHPYIIWTSDKFQDNSDYIDTFTVIPLTSSTRERDKGLPTAYPINATVRNGLDKQSFALVHQICTVDANCFNDSCGIPHGSIAWGWIATDALSSVQLYYISGLFCPLIYSFTISSGAPPAERTQ